MTLVVGFRTRSVRRKTDALVIFSTGHTTRLNVRFLSLNLPYSWHQTVFLDPMEQGASLQILPPHLLLASSQQQWTVLTASAVQHFTGHLLRACCFSHICPCYKTFWTRILEPLLRSYEQNQPGAQFLPCIFISILYMFRATMCTSSGEISVSIRHQVFVTLCRWPFVMHGGMKFHPTMHNRRSSKQSDKYQMSYWYSYFSWWLAHSCPKHVENRNKHTKKEFCTMLVLFARLYKDARSTNHKILQF
jgi:hypothetical protein